jgi:hypothetical protein
MVPEEPKPSAQKQIGSLTTVQVVASISDSAFYGCAALARTDLTPGGAVGRFAFYRCQSMPAVTLQSNLTSIGDSAFAFCLSLDSVSVLPPVPPAMGIGVFERIPTTCTFTCPPAAFAAYNAHLPWRRCFPPVYPYFFHVFDHLHAIVTALNPMAAPAELADLTFRDTVYAAGQQFPLKYLDPAAFAANSLIRKITFPPTFSIIPEAFLAESKVLDTVIMQSLTPPVLRDGAFAGLPWSCTFTCPPEALETYRADPLWTPFFPPLYPISFSVLNPDSRKPQAIVTGVNPRSSDWYSGVLLIPAEVYRAGRLLAVTTLEPALFAGCTDLTDITLPASVTRLPDKLFAGSPLRSITLLTTKPPALGDSVFADISPQCLLACPSDALPLYQADPDWFPYFPAYDFSFRVGNDGRATLTRFDNAAPSPDVVIPSFVYHSVGRTAPIAAVAPQAFAGCALIRSVTLPNSITVIEPRTFASCTSLAAITIAAGITSIGEQAFAGCASLKRVDILCRTPPELRHGAFDDIPFDCLFSAPSESLPLYCYLPEWKPFFPNYDVAFRVENGQAIVTGFASDGLALSGVLAIPDTVWRDRIPYPVVAIDSAAFAAAAHITAVFLPDNLAVLGTAAFRDCVNLSGLRSPPAVTALPTSLFRGCTSLAAFNVPSSVTSLGRAAFSGCTALKRISLPAVADIPQETFAGCASLASVTIPASVAAIDDAAFAGCGNLGAVNILAGSPPTLALDAFEGIPEGCRFSVPGELLPAYRAHPRWQAFFPFPQADIPQAAMPEAALSISPQTPAAALDAIPAATPDADYDVLFRIENRQAFITGPKAPHATGVTIPDAVLADGVLYPVVAIDPLAFFDCDGLAAVSLQASEPPLLGAHAFTNINPHCRFDAPDGALAAYRAHPEWAPFFPPVYPVLFRTLGYAALVTAPDTRCPDWATGAISVPADVCRAGVTYRVFAIDKAAFDGCTSLLSVTLPPTITLIGPDAFARCTALDAFSLLSPAPPILSAGAFTAANPHCRFAAPDGALPLYLASPSWAPYFASTPAHALADTALADSPEDFEALDLAALALAATTATTAETPQAQQAPQAPQVSQTQALITSPLPADAGEVVTLYSLCGKLLYRGLAGRCTLPGGLYIVVPTRGLPRKQYFRNACPPH